MLRIVSGSALVHCLLNPYPPHLEGKQVADTPTRKMGLEWELIGLSGNKPNVDQIDGL